MEDRSEGAASAAGRGVWGLDRGHFAMTRPGDPRLDEAGPFPLSLSTRLSGQPPPALLASIWGFCSHFQGAEDFSLSPKAERAVLARIIVIINILMALTFPGCPLGVTVISFNHTVLQRNNDKSKSISKCFANINSVTLVSGGNAIILIIPYFIDEETGQVHELTCFKSQALYLV